MEDRKADNSEGSNRTFMELKSLINRFGILPEVVLIVPLWNRNALCVENLARTSCSNRTFMELKYTNSLYPLSSGRVLIVPLWN